MSGKGHPRPRRPVWKPSARSRVLEYIGRIWKQITLKRALIVVLVLPALIYLYSEVTRDNLIIDPFGVPKSFNESGLTGEVIANHIGDVMRQIETSAKTTMNKDRLTVLRDEGSMPDVEIPGTKLGLKTLVEITRAIFARHPKHVGGDIVIAAPPAADPANVDAHVTFYVAQGRERSQAISLTAPANDIDSLTQTIAEKILEQVNPYILAVWKDDHHEFDRASEIVQRLIEDPAQDRHHVVAAYNLWGTVLDAQGKRDEAISKYQKAVELDPKLALAYSNWGDALYAQGNHEEARAKYQKAIELSPKYAPAYYNNWGYALAGQGKRDEAIIKYRKAVELDPKYAAAYSNWGAALDFQGKHDEAIAKYQKAIELDPKYAAAYNNWGVVLHTQGKYDEAIAKYQKALELDPKHAEFYYSWGVTLHTQGKYDEAIAKYQKAVELDPKYARPYNSWGVSLHAQGKHDEAIAKYQKAVELDPKYADAYISWGDALDSRGRHAEAQKKFAKARELSPPK